MPNQSPISPDTILRMAEEVLGTPVTEKDAQVLSALLGHLMADMDAMRKFDPSGAEPVTLYEARP